MNWASLSRVVMFLCFLAVLPCANSARARDNQPVALSETIGVDIDADERDTYALFPDIEGFVTAQVVRTSASKYRLDYTYLKDGKQKRASRSVGEKAWTDTRTHVRLVEEYEASVTRGEEPEGEDWQQYRMALRYAARARYDLAKTLIDDVDSEHVSSPLREKAESLRTDINELVGVKGAFFQPGALAYERSGRTNLMIFAGYYGIWAGIATAWAIDLKGGGNDDLLDAAALLVIPGVSLYLAYQLSKNTDMGKGRAAIISLGGNMGTWQGLGWSAIADMKGKDVAAVGLASGLVGIAAGSFLGSKIHFSEGHGLLTEYSLLWGIWFGLVAGGLTDRDGDDLLRSALIGSDVLVLCTGIAARNARMSENRVRLISLSGILGGVAGTGLLVLLDEQDEPAVWGTLGASSAVGLALGYLLTWNFDEGKDLSLRSTGSEIARRAANARESTLSFRPALGVGRDPFQPDRLVTTVGLSMTF